ncbi:hypothetical protein [Wolbachia endosymbiont of Oedothorax gibbosus]|uniref:hypothetical protein n=1 Tax=Wolbachia endosymbiont of Oedothorax gibbosus TaxID=931100 RepID=UPI003514B021
MYRVTRTTLMKWITRFKEGGVITPPTMLQIFLFFSIMSRRVWQLFYAEHHVYILNVNYLN